MNDLQPLQHVALIIEGEAEIRELAAALLEETELKVVEAEDAETAMAYLEKHGSEVAMIFADIQLPGDTDGAELVKIATGRWPTIKIIVTSDGGGDRPATVPDCVTFIRKPWRGLDVLIQAEMAIHQSQLSAV